MTAGNRFLWRLKLITLALAIAGSVDACAAATSHGGLAMARADRSPRRVRSLADLTPDRLNANRGTPRGLEALDHDKGPRGLQHTSVLPGLPRQTRVRHLPDTAVRDGTANPLKCLTEVPPRRDGRVVDGGGLENVSGSVIPRRLYFRGQLHPNMRKTWPEFA